MSTAEEDLSPDLLDCVSRPTRRLDHKIQVIQVMGRLQVFLSRVDRLIAIYASFVEAGSEVSAI